MVEFDMALKVVEMGPSRLALVGELDLAGVPEVERRLADCHGDVLLNCSQLTFVDASGIGLFVRARHACESRGVKFELEEPSRCLVRVLKLTDLEAVFLPATNGSVS